MCLVVFGVCVVVFGVLLGRAAWWPLGRPGTRGGVVFGVLLGCYWGVIGVLPEFWRAAPEAAMLWGGEEFEYPPSPRGGAQDPVDQDFAHMHSAAGHLRAAGLRL